MSTESGTDDTPGDESSASTGLSGLEQQIADRMTELAAAAEEYYKLQILLDTIDGRERLPVPDFLVPLLPEPEPVDEQRRLRARQRAAERAARLQPPPRRRRSSRRRTDPPPAD